jgi:hypothetical protein
VHVAALAAVTGHSHERRARGAWKLDSGRVLVSGDSGGAAPGSGMRQELVGAVGRGSAAAAAPGDEQWSEAGDAQAAEKVATSYSP